MSEDDPKCSIPPKDRSGLRIAAMVCCTLLGGGAWVLVGVDALAVEPALGFSGAALSGVLLLAGKKLGVSAVPLALSGATVGAHMMGML